MEFSFLRKLIHKAETPTGLCCLYIMPDKLVIAHATYNKTVTITFVETYIYQPDSLKSVLQQVIKKHNLENTSCSWVLHLSYYQLLLIDSPEVETKEIPLALRWQVKNLLDFPIEDAALEYFPIPSSSTKPKKIYVAAAQKSKLQPIVDTISKAGFRLKFIDIPELALKNIISYYDDSDCYLGLLVLNHADAEFIITHQKQLLLTRLLFFPEKADLNILQDTQNGIPDWFHGLILEIQRSFTYCQNQLHQDLPRKLLILSATSDMANIISPLLEIECENLQIEKKLDLAYPLKEGEYLPKEFLVTIGGALREVIANAAN